jgi:hypothetical protein
MPFVLQERSDYLGFIPRAELKETPMNWIFEAYSNVYSTAMMQDRDSVVHAASAKAALTKRPSTFSRLFGRA